MLLIGICLNTILFAQTTETPKNHDDSLKLAKSIIDTLSISDLTKQKERFTYKTRKEPNNIINKEILLYIDEKLKTK